MPTVPPPAISAAISRAATSGATTGLAWSCARAVVANNSVQSATACSTVSTDRHGPYMIGAGGGALGADVRPAVARIDDAQPRERKIAHRARGHAMFSPSCGSTRMTTGAGRG